MKTLNDVAKQYRKSVAKAIYPGVPYTQYKRSKNSKLRPNPPGQGSQAFDTGNLLTKFISDPQNALNRIASKIGGGYQLVVNIAPNGASYGRWVHNGTTRMKKRPYGELGANDADFKAVLDEFLADEVNDVVEGEMEILNEMFNKAGFKVT